MKKIVNISVSDRYYDREPEQRLGTDIVLSNF